MNSNRVIMAASGGAAALISAVLGVYAYSVWLEDDELVQNLEASKAAAQRAVSGRVSPEKASIDAIKANTASLRDWIDESLAFVSRGDANFSSPVSPERFKQIMLEDAREIAKIPGSAAGSIVRAGFGFGLGEYISGSAMPDAGNLSDLRRTWYDIKTIVNILASSSVQEITDISVEEQRRTEPEKKDKRASTQRSSAKRRPSDRRENGWMAHASAKTYNVKFLAKPSALVKVCNSIALSPRFMTVDSYSFAKERDTLAEKLSPAPVRSGRPGRQLPSVAHEKPEEEKGLVTDPSLEPPFTVSARLTVYDFGTAPAGQLDVKEEECE